jgi:hypothetical protein
VAKLTLNASAKRKQRAVIKQNQAVVPASGRCYRFTAST